MNYFQNVFVTGTNLIFFALAAAIFLITTYFVSYIFWKELIENNKKLETIKKKGSEKPYSEDDSGDLGF